MQLFQPAEIPNGMSFATNSFATNNKQLPIPERAGYQFEGWWTTPTPTQGEIKWSETTIFTTNTTIAARTLYARWIPKTIPAPVAFNKNEHFEYV